MNNEGSSSSKVFHAFERELVTVSIEKLLPLKSLRPGTKLSKKYSQIVRSIETVGLVEPPVVKVNPSDQNSYFLLDGHIRVEALKDLGRASVDCIVSKDDDTYTYNKRVNRIVPIQEHRMVLRAVERGVPESRIAEALGLEVSSVRRRERMLDGICADAVDILKDSPCALIVFEILRKMNPIRQIEAAELMHGQKNFSSVFAKALLAATPANQLVRPEGRAIDASSGVTSEQIAKMEKELASLLSLVKSVEDTYGIDNLHLTVARGYVSKLLANARVVRWLAQRRQEYLSEFQSIVEDDLVLTRKAWSSSLTDDAVFHHASLGHSIRWRQVIWVGEQKRLSLAFRVH